MTDFAKTAGERIDDPDRETIEGARTMLAKYQTLRDKLKYPHPWYTR